MNDKNNLIENGYHIVGNVNRNRPAKIYYELYGDKNATNKVLLVMGFMQNGKAWKLQVDYLLKQPNFQICIYDNRGIGNSNSFSISVNEQARDAVDLMKCLKWKNVNVVGTSLGGTVTVFISSYAEKELINSVIISAAHNGIFSPFLPKGMLYYLKSFKELNRKKRINLICKSLFSEKFLNEPSLSEPHKKKMEAMEDRAILTKATNSPSLLTFFGNLFSLIFHRFPNSVLNDIKSKPWLNICVVSGTKDILIDIKYTKKKLVNKINPIKYKLLESGHCVNIEKADEFNNNILDHIKTSNIINQKRNNNINMTNSLKNINTCYNNNNNNNYFSLFKKIFKFIK